MDAMEFRIEFGGEPQDVTLTTSGRANADGFRQMNEELVSDPRFRPGMAILVDHSELDVSGLGPDDVEAIGASVIRLGDLIGPSPVAIVGADMMTVAVSRVSRAYASPAPLRARSFYGRDEALAWLRDPEAEDSLPG
jgi:hypothetical protein